MRRFAGALLCFALVACGGDKPTASDAPDGRIAPGVYSGVTTHDATGGLRGFEIRLTQGSASDMVDIAECNGQCRVQSVPVRAGKGGLSFEYSVVGRDGPTVVALTPDDGTVELTAEFGNGIESHRLRKVSAPMALPPKGQRTQLNPARP